MAHNSQSHVFSQIPKAEIPRSTFVRSHGYKTTFDSGYLVPIYVDEALPGDTFKVNANIFARLATPIVPVMDNLYMDVFFFFVPNRLVWQNWQRFMGEQPNPGDSTDFLTPQIICPAHLGGNFTHSVFDYMGIPDTTISIEVSALPFRGLNLIYNEWFRDENLQTRVPQHVGDGPDLYTDYALMKRGKRHDYFTSALPWPQKGPAMELPLGGYANVETFGPPNDRPLFRGVSGGNAVPLHVATVTAAAPVSINSSSFTAASDIVWGVTNLRANLNTATGVTINELREAFQIQRLYERDARGGTRYTEILKSHFGVTSPDARLQRPEYLGGGTVNVSINPVQQTSATGTGDTPQGNLAAYGVVGHSGHGFTKSFVEHGFVFGLVSVRADMSYQYGLPRMWSRKTRFDYYWPVLSHLGEQAILTKEIWCDGQAGDDVIFGYQERWAEYRYHPSVITGKFRSNDPQSLDIWHLAQEYPSAPLLNATFIEENPPVKRISAVPSEPDFMLDAFFNVTTARPMPTYSVPGLIDHF